MKIGIYDPYLDDLGGGEKYMMTIAQSLSEKYDVSVFWDNKQDVEELLKRFSLDLTKVRIVKNIFAYGISFWDKLKATGKYDAIIFLSDGSIPLSLSKKLFLHLQQPLENLNTHSLKNIVKLARVTAVFCNSKFTLSFNEKKLSNVKSTIIYPPVAIQKKNVKKENIILHVGRFRVRNVDVSDYKKQDVMINSFKQMVDKKMIKDWKFVLAVSYKKEDEERFLMLQNSAKEYPISFLVNKSNDELWDIYNKAKIYWHASGYGEDLEKHPEYAEHFGISTVEAMGAGAVPVVINSGGQKEIVINEENGYLWDTIEELQANTVRLIKDAGLWNKMSEQASLRAKDFSYEKFHEQIEKLVENK
jgi:glycosyltransferase involved in cell wall biosynthesis